MRYREKRRPVLIDVGHKVVKSQILVAETAQAADVALSLRENGWQPYKVRFDPNANAWIASSLEGLRGR